MMKNIALASTLIGLAFAENNWDVACTNGKCSFQGGDGVNTAWNTVDVDASSATLSDITKAAGWKITNCSPTWSSGVAHVQLSCQGTAQQVALCDHLFDGGDAVNKVVRLPEACGTGPFARVVSVQEASTNLFDLAIDYDFTQIPPNEAESLTFTVTASNVQGASAGTAVRARHDLAERKYPIQVAKRVDLSKTFNLPPINFSKAFTLVNQSFNCPAGDGGVGVDASINIGASVAVDAQMAFGVSISTRILPFPKVTSFQLSGTMTGNAGATVDLTASATGSFGTGDIKLFEVGLPALDVPGVFSVGPQFVINTNVDADLQLQAKVRAGATYQFPKVDLVFPASGGKSVASITPTPDALGLALEPGVTADGKVTAHLVPALNFGFDILSGLASAKVFLKVDGSATVGVKGEVSANITPGDIQTKASGCVDLSAGVDVSAGASGSIPGIFDDGTSFSIFKKDFDLFQRCFGDSGMRRSRFRARRTARRSSSTTPSIARRAISCPSPGSGGILDTVLDLVAQ